MKLALLLTLVFGSSSKAWQLASDPPQFITAANRSQPLTLAIGPACGSLSDANFTEVNTGVNLNATKTVVAFGDSWTSNGSNGTVPFAPVVFPPNPSAGARFGNNERARASNGYVWVEDVANTLGAKLINYAVGGAVVDLQAWNSTNKGPTMTSDNLLRTDLVHEVDLFLQQGHWLSDLDPNSTLYVLAFGINDNTQFGIAGGNWDLASTSMMNQISLLQQNGAQNFLVHWVYFNETANVEPFQNRIFSGLKALQRSKGINFVSVNLARLFGQINATPKSFGYTNTTCLASQNTTDFGCNDPDHSVFYIPGHPSLTTHELINQYTLEVAEQC